MVFNIIYLVFQILYIAIIARVLIALLLNLQPELKRNQNKIWKSFLKVVYEITEPILAPIRAWNPITISGFDFSPLFAFLILRVIHIFLIRLLGFALL